MSTILVVDDEAGIRQLCYDALTRDGYDVVTVPRGDQVFSLMKTKKIDLILMDIEIPGEEGLSLLNRMPREKDKRVPVVVFSGAVTPEIEKKAIQAGAVDVLRKGLGMQELRDKVRKILSHKGLISGEPSAEGEAEKLLVVDDEDGVRKLLCQFFRRKGLQVMEAASGEEAIRMVREQKPSMILLDVSMPGMDGILTLRKIREFNTKVGVVMATGMQDEVIAKEASDLGAYDYVLKPFDMKYLELVVFTRLMLSS